MLRKSLILTAILTLAACSDGADTETVEEPVANKAAPTKPAEAAPTPAVASNAASTEKDADVNAIPAPADVAAAPADATTTSSGLAYKVLQAGTGEAHPAAADKVEVHYTGWTIDGKMFDSSVVREETITFGLNQVIKGWTEGVQLMVVGEKTRFWIPAGLAYGETPRRPGAPSGMLVFDIELFNIVEAPKPPAVPEDVDKPPTDSKTTTSGLSYKVLKAGTGDAHPSATSRVEVHYSGWTRDGKMFDSSVMRGQTITFGLNQVIPGWTEGVQLMTVGEKTRFWIPAGLAYGDTPRRPGAPAGMLVFDIELFNIE
ncbi:MAG: peptidylprolyl isomerase [Proteobacteria bacterium]|nr:peptidylprolyl isomerase [Pseudomonadota bacterium]